MIRYHWDPAAVLAQIQAIDPRWTAKARRRSAAIIKAAKYAEKSAIWSSVKPVFMLLQHNKCAFCERQFENPDYGKIEFDLEHFRPKSSVEVWPDPIRHAHLHYEFSTGEHSESGYYWLAYELENYAASCKVCNTIFKSNFFPVATDRARAPDAPLDEEAAYLCYPLGQRDADPQDLIGFVATTAIPVANTAAARRRGQIIIDFFGLNSRQQLHRERARMIALFGASLAARHEGHATATDHQLLAQLSSPKLPHAGCLRAFEQVWPRDPQLAARIHDACRRYAVSDDTVLPPVF